MTNDTAVSPVITLRPATAEDTAFLLKLFASTREEFKMLLADESQLAALISMQFNFQKQQYQDGYPGGKDDIILLHDELIGRIFVDEGERVITLVDVAVLPEYRNRGIGRKLVNDLLVRAAAAKKPVRLHVLKSNPARRLYQSLGFSDVSEDSMYYEMSCETTTA